MLWTLWGMEAGPGWHIPAQGKAALALCHGRERDLLVPCFCHQRRWERVGICPPSGIPAVKVLQLTAVGWRYSAQQARVGGDAEVLVPLPGCITLTRDGTAPGWDAV